MSVVTVMLPTFWQFIWFVKSLGDLGAKAVCDLRLVPFTGSEHHVRSEALCSHVVAPLEYVYVHIASVQRSLSPDPVGLAQRTQLTFDAEGAGMSIGLESHVAI